MVRTKLKNMTVADIRQLLITQPILVKPDLPIEDFLGTLVKDLRMRHVYVIDEHNVLIGVVRMNTVVKYLFPFSAFVMLNQSDAILKESLNFGAKTVRDIMDSYPHFVEETTLLSDMAEILIKEKINELPVVDSERRVIGQVNVYEIITAYLHKKL